MPAEDDSSFSMIDVRSIIDQYIVRSYIFSDYAATRTSSASASGITSIRVN